MLGIWVAKLTLIVLHLLHRQGTSLPGKLALRFTPGLLDKLGRQLQTCVVVTGTNGKTTTARLLASMLEADEPIIHNTEGANMAQGLTSALLVHTNWLGRLRVKKALLEIDEATLPLVVNSFPVQLAVVTNVFRDQLDRYGEVDMTLQKIIEGLQQTHAKLLFNSDDPLSYSIGLHFDKARTCYYGMSQTMAHPARRHATRDGQHCLKCGHRLTYHGFFYGQLGLYHCPNCDFGRLEPSFTGNYNGASLQVAGGTAWTSPIDYALPVRGVFNAYNALCAISAATLLGISPNTIQEGLNRFVAPLGRMQVYATSPPAILNLIKNPTGCDSVLQAVVNEPGTKILCIAINDLAADGRDVSWLWDADFEQIAEDTDVAYCVTTGLRAEDMALRLKYAGLPVDRITFEPELASGINLAMASAKALENASVYVLTTYTALYDTAQILKNKVNTHDDASYRASVS